MYPKTLHLFILKYSLGLFRVGALLNMGTSSIKYGVRKKWGKNNGQMTKTPNISVKNYLCDLLLDNLSESFRNMIS